eukprot:scaffold1810_cov60-Cyclotella_meneghiniana.AAC.2
MVEQNLLSSQTNSSTSLSPTADPATASRIQIPTTSIDRSIILNFIDTRLAQIKSSFQQQQQQTHGSNPAKTAFYLQCMDDAIVSIKRQITNLTEPIDDELLQQELDRLELRYRSCTLQTIDDDDTSSSSSEQEDVDVSFDDDDILDTEAYAKVKELRAAGREIANRVIDTREETVGRALNITERGVVELLNVHGYATKNDEQDESIDNHSGGETASATTINSSIVEPLNTALQNLTSSLTNIDSNGNLTNKLNSIRETITTIDASVDKYQRVSQGEENVISQTERAIMEAATAMNREEGGNRVVMGEETMNDADGILARLLAGAL